MLEHGNMYALGSAQHRRGLNWACLAGRPSAPFWGRRNVATLLCLCTIWGCAKEGPRCPPRGARK
eukprot:1675370-Pyramimonas_sp.AAC.1